MKGTFLYFLVNFRTLCTTFASSTKTTPLIIYVRNLLASSRCSTSRTNSQRVTIDFAISPLCSGYHLRRYRYLPSYPLFPVNKFQIFLISRLLVFDSCNRNNQIINYLSLHKLTYIYEVNFILRSFLCSNSFNEC